MKLLLIDSSEHPLPNALESTARAAGWEVLRASSYAEIDAAACHAALLAPPAPTGGAQGGPSDFHQLVQRLDDQHVPTLIFPGATLPLSIPPGEFVEVVGPDFSAAEWRGRFTMIERYQGQVQGLERELAVMQRLGRQLNDHFQDLDQEMRLAARLQRDFLPDIKDPIHGVRYAALFRPATWVSGDIFDVFHVDEEHTAFYLADAVGHGVASGLLTIFIKRAIVAQEFDHGAPRLLAPDETLSRLNRLLVKQALPNCQFVTAWYGLLNHRNHRLRFARAGHPYPLLLGRDGSVTELQSGGGLLGILAEETFETGEVPLRPGDKIVIYSDGLECSFPPPNSATTTSFSPIAHFSSFAASSIAELITQLERQIVQESGSLSPQDDVTILGLEILNS